MSSSALTGELQPQQGGRRTQHLASIWQFGLSGLGAITLLSLALGLAVMLGMRLWSGIPAEGGNPLTLAQLVMLCLTLGAGLLFSAGLALARLLGRPLQRYPDWLARLKPWPFLAVWPLVVIAGHWVLRLQGLAWLIWPLLHFLAIGLPVWAVLYLAVRRLPAGQPQRQWGAFSAGLVLAPAILIVLEGLAGVAMILLIAIGVGQDPALVRQLESLAPQLSGPRLAPQEIMEKLAPLLFRPGSLFLIMAFIAGVVPLLEELIKPIAVWLLIRHDLSPMGGFVVGALSGAGFALSESLAQASSVNDWAFIVTARAGTAAVHIFTTALTGGALALAWRTGRYFRLALAFLSAVTLHGLWNAFSTLLAFNELSYMVERQPFFDPLRTWASSAMFVAAFLSVGSVIALVAARRSLERFMQRRLSRNSAAPTLPISGTDAPDFQI